MCPAGKKVLKEDMVTNSKAFKQIITREPPNHRALGLVSDLRGNIKIIGNYAHIFVVPA